MDRDTPAYVRLFHLLGAIRELSPFSDMSADEEQLLRELIVRWHETSLISVSDMMSRAERTSPSSIYRRLIALRDKGLIVMRVDDDDRRVKYVEPTHKADDYMRQVAQSVDIAFRRESKA